MKQVQSLFFSWDVNSQEYSHTWKTVYFSLGQAKFPRKTALLEVQANHSFKARRGCPSNLEHPKRQTVLLLSLSKVKIVAYKGTNWLMEATSASQSPNNNYSSKWLSCMEKTSNNRWRSEIMAIFLRLYSIL